MKLRTKFFLVLLLFASLFVSYVHLLWLPQMKTEMVELTERTSRAHLNTTAEGLVPFLLENQLANVHETLNAIVEDNPQWLELTLYSPKGQLLYPLDPPAVEYSDKETLQISVGVGFLEPHLAELNLVLDMRPALATANALEYKLGIALLLMLGVFLLVLGLEIELMVGRPLSRLVNASRALAAGNYDHPLPDSNTDEIGELARGFAEMRADLRQAHQHMENEVDRHRRKADELEQKRAEANFLATHDALTGLVNRREFDRCLGQALDESQSYEVEHSLLFIDLDRFKQVNDQCGHAAGDELLKEIVALIAAQIRNKDIFARLGGDEFALLLTCCSAEDAAQLGRNICAEVARYKFFWQGDFFSVGCSIGASASTAVDNIETWSRQADMACYRAKAAGRGCVIRHCDMPAEPSLTPG